MPSDVDKPSPKTDFSVEELEDGYIDYGNPKVAKAELKKAFATYIDPVGGRTGRPTAYSTNMRKFKKIPGKPYRKTMKFNLERCLRLLGLIRGAQFFDPACRLCGVKPESVRRWVERGEREQSGPYFVFAKALDAATETAVATVVQRVHTSVLAPMNPKDAADVGMRWLRMRDKEHFGDSSSVDVTTKGEALSNGVPPMMFTIKYVDPEDATPATDAEKIAGI